MKSHFEKLVQEVSPPPQRRTVQTGGLFVGLSTEPEIWGQRDNRFKSDLDDTHADGQVEQPELPAAKIDEEQIRIELNLSKHLTVAELQALRRNFARQNHPDADPGDASVREERMKIANMIIDQQIELRSKS